MQTGQFPGNFKLFYPFGFSTLTIQIQITQYCLYEGFDLGTRKVGCLDLSCCFTEEAQRKSVRLMSGCRGIRHF